MREGKVEVLILAGRRPGGDALAAAEGCPVKGFIPIGGRPMVAWVLEAVRGLETAGTIRVALPEALTGHRICRELAAAGVRAIPAEESPAATVAAVCGGSAPGERTLVLTADHPLLRRETLRGFLRRASAVEAGIVAGVTDCAAIERTYPGARVSTGLRFAEGQFTGCNLFLLRGTEGARAAAFWRRMEGLRKRPWRIAASLGPGLLLRYRLGRLSLGDAARELGGRMKAKAAFIVLDDPLAGMDVDRAEDLAFARSRLEGA